MAEVIAQAQLAAVAAAPHIDVSVLADGGAVVLSAHDAPHRCVLQSLHDCEFQPLGMVAQTQLPTCIVPCTD